MNTATKEIVDDILRLKQEKSRMMVEIRFDVLVELAEELQQTDTRLRALEFAVQAVKEQYKTEVKI